MRQCDSACILHTETRHQSCSAWTLQVWAHPRYGDRLDIGLERQVDESLKAQEVSPEQTSCTVLSSMQVSGESTCLRRPSTQVTAPSTRSNLRLQIY